MFQKNSFTHRKLNPIKGGVEFVPVGRWRLFLSTGHDQSQLLHVTGRRVEPLSGQGTLVSPGVVRGRVLAAFVAAAVTDQGNAIWIKVWTAIKIILSFVSPSN